jgi:predicted nicotinamide N-methyase
VTLDSCSRCSRPPVANLGDARSVFAPGGSPQRTRTSIARPLVDVSDDDVNASRVDIFTKRTQNVAHCRQSRARARRAMSPSPSTWADALDDWRGGSASDYAECTSFNTTGQLVWPAARRLVEYLERSGALEGVETALELGSGNGWLGCVLARACAAPRGSLRTLTLTEMEAGGALRWLRTRVEANASATAATSERERNNDGSEEAGAVTFELRCKALDWNDVDSALTTDDLRYDVVLGADLVYEDAGVHMLPRVIKKLLDANPKAVCYYSHTKHRYDGMDMDFFEAIERAGLTREEVREPEVPSPPPSPPPFESLFPEQRVAVYRIALA